MTTLEQIEPYESAHAVVVESYTTNDGQVIVNIEASPVTPGYYLRGLLKHAGSGYRPAEHDEVGEVASIEEARALMDRVADTVVGRWAGTVKRQPRRPNGAESRNLNIRVPVDVLDAAKTASRERGETLSAAVVDLLRGYIAKE